MPRFKNQSPGDKEKKPPQGGGGLVRRYYLTEIIGTGTWEDPFLPAVAEYGGDWGMIDLRPDSTKKAGYAVAYLDTEQVPADDKIKLLALDSELGIEDEKIKQTVNAALASNINGKTVPAVLSELLIDGAVPGICKKIKPSRAGIKRIVLGGKIFYGPPLLSHKKGTITESFNTGDSDTLGPDLTWVETDGDIDIVSNRAVTQGAGATINLAYADEEEPFTDDHYSQVLMVGKGNVYWWGVTVRCEAGGQYDWYLFASVANTSKFVLWKRVDGGITGLASTTTGWSDPDNDTYRLEVNGSLLVAKENGAEVLSTTDTAITGNTKCGFGGQDSGHTFDNFEAADLNAEFTGWKSPGTVSNETRAGGNYNWSDVDNAKSSDDSYAWSNCYATPGYTHWLRCTNFGFTPTDIPLGSIILGIEVKIERKGGSSEDQKDSSIRLRKTAGQEGDDKADTSTWWPTSDETVTYSWTAEEIGEIDDGDLRDPNAGVDISAWMDANFAYIDHVQMRVLFSWTPALAGTIAGQAALQGALSVARKIAGAIAAQSDVSGALKVSKELTGAIASQSSVQAALGLLRKITGTTAGQSLVQGIIGVVRKLAGTVGAQSGVSGELSLGAEEELSGTIGGQSTVEGDLTVERGLTGEVAAQAGIAGEMSRILGLAGTITAQSSVTGELTTGEILLSGIIAAEATVEGGLSGIWRITGEVAAKAGVEGVLTVPGPGQRQSGMFLVM